jgi:hypothetical protein
MPLKIAYTAMALELPQKDSAPEPHTGTPTGLKRIPVERQTAFCSGINANIRATAERNLISSQRIYLCGKFSSFDVDDIQPARKDFADLPHFGLAERAD